MPATDPIGRVRSRGPRRRRRLLVGTAVLLVLVLAGLGVVVFSPLLATREVSVEGTSLLEPQRVVEAAQVPLGTPLPRQDLPAIEQRVQGMAPVREVEATRTWPHTLQLRVRERTPVLATPAGRAFMLVDGEGVSYARVADKPPGVLATEEPVEDPQVLSAMARTVGSLPDDLGDQVVAVRASSDADVQLVLEQDRTIVWGGPEDAQVKAEVVRVLLDTVEGATVYDVSAPSFPATR